MFPPKTSVGTQKVVDRGNAMPRPGSSRRGTQPDGAANSAMTSSWFMVEDSAAASGTGSHHTPESQPGQSPGTEPASTMPQPRASDIAALLLNNFAHVTGGEIHEQPIVAIPATSWKDILTADLKDLVKVFNFLVWAGSLHLRPRSMNYYYVVCDCREGDWGQIRQFLAILDRVLPTGAQLVSVVARTGRLSLAKFGLKSFLDSLQIKVEIVPTLQALQSSFPLHVLSTDFGGRLRFGNDDWVSLFMVAETITDQCARLAKVLVEMAERCRNMPVPSASSETEELSERRNTEVQLLVEDARQQTGQANQLVREMRVENCKWDLTPTTNHYIGLSQRIKAEASGLDIASQRLVVVWEKQRDRLKTVSQSQKYREVMCEFRVEAQKEHGLIKKVTGSSLSSAQELLDEHHRHQDALNSSLYKNAPLLLEEIDFFTARPHCYMPEDTRELCSKLQQELQQLTAAMTLQTRHLETSTSLFISLKEGLELCDEGLRLLATQSMEACLSEASANDALLILGRYLDRLEDIDGMAMASSAATLPLSAPMLAEIAKLKQKVPEIRNLVTARVEGIMTLASKHAEMKVQLSVAVEKGSVSGHSAGSTTPPPMQDTAGCYATSSDVSITMPTSPSMENSSSSHVSNVGSVGGSPVTSRRHASLASRRQRFAPPRRSTTTSALPSDHSPGMPNDLLSRAASVQLSPAHLSSSITPESMMIDDELLFQEPIEDSETDEHVLEKRRYIMEELIETERLYIKDLKETLDHYWAAVGPERDGVPPSLRAKQSVLFGNLPRIYEFHKSMFLEELEDCADTPERVGLCFLNKQRSFQLYVSYCKNKYKSDAFLADCEMSFFEAIGKARGHRLSLKTYLIKPVQRITKYQLLLKEMMSKCGGAPMAKVALQRALDEMLDILQHLNNVMHSSGIIGFPGSLLEQGHLLLQDSFIAWKEGTGRLKLLRNHSKSERERHVFLYEQVLIFSKKRQQSEGDRQTLYSYKDSIKVSELALTETSGGLARRFQVAQHKHDRAYTLQARSASVKTTWVGELRSLLEYQLNMMQDIAKQEEGLMTLPRGYPGRLSEASSPAIQAGGFNVRSSLMLSKTKEMHWSQSTLTRRNTLRASAIDGVHSEQAVDGNMATGGKVSPGLSQSLGNLSMDSLGGDELLDGDDTDGCDSGGLAVASKPTSASDVVAEVNRPVQVLDEALVVARPDQRQFYAVTAEFTESEDVHFPVGVAVEVLQLGHGGWWAVRKVETHEFAWMPASYLTEIGRSSLPLLETSI